MSDIKDMIDAIAKGEATTAMFVDCGMDGWAADAYQGSMNALLEFAPTVLTGKFQIDGNWAPEGCDATVIWWPDGKGGGIEVVASAADKCPARASLLAVLRAHQTLGPQQKAGRA